MYQDERKIHLGLSVKADGKREITLNFSGVIPIAGDSSIEEMRATADRMYQAMNRQIEDWQRGSSPRTLRIDERAVANVNPSAFAPRLAPQDPELRPAPHADPETGEVFESEDSPEPPIPNPAQQIPRDEEVAIGATVLGEYIPYPPAEWLEIPLTDVDPETQEHGGQLKAINAALAGIGMGGDKRHGACAQILAGYGPIHGHAATAVVNSARHLSKAEAHVILSWIDQAGAAAHRRLMEASGHGMLFAIVDPPAPCVRNPDPVIAIAKPEYEEPKPPVKPVDPFTLLLERFPDMDVFDDENAEVVEAAHAEHRKAMERYKIELESYELATEALAIAAEERSLAETARLASSEEEEGATGDAFHAAPEITLSGDQQRAVDRVMEAVRNRENACIFVTGKAGTGKSTVLRAIKDRARCVVTAPTALAAVNVGGTTIHRFFSLKVGPVTRGKVGPVSRWNEPVVRRADVIVVDEVSMCRADLLDGVNVALQKTMRNNLPFGGKLVAFFGDMWQLEPVVKEGGEQEFIREKYGTPFWFEAEVFRKIQATIDDVGTIAPEVIDLHEVFRQAGDPDFIAALNAVRYGWPSGLEWINAHARRDNPGDAIAITFTNKHAETVNARRLTSLRTEPIAYQAEISGDFPENDAPVPRELVLKVGARVMVAKNVMVDDGSFVNNGAIGEVTRLEEKRVHVELADGRDVCIESAKWSKIEYKYDREKDDIAEQEAGGFTQIPLKLAWAISTHKSQGQTLQSAVLEMEMPAFAHGQLYVALSRVKTIDGLFLRRTIVPDDLRVHPRIREFTGVPAETLVPTNKGAFAAR